MRSVFRRLATIAVAVLVFVGLEPAGATGNTSRSQRHASVAPVIGLTKLGDPAAVRAGQQLYPVIDLALTKIDEPDPVFVGDELTYTLGVRNNGPDTATDVVVTDSLPSETVYISATPSQGSCTGDRIITCKLGTLAAGGTASIVVVVRPTATGTITNNAVVGGHEVESDTSNNSAFADTRVRSLPPAPCFTLSVSPHLLTVGQRTIVRVRARRGDRVAGGLPVSLRGPRLALRGRTDAHGLVRFAVRPTRPGIIRIRVLNRRTCTVQQVGIAGQPQHTG